MRRRRPHRNTYSHDDISANAHGYNDTNLGGYRQAYDYTYRRYCRHRGHRRRVHYSPTPGR